MIILMDSREQSPFLFDHPRYEGVPVKTIGLPTGDYSIEGFEDRIAVERKSMPDLLGSISTGRDRFAREMERSMELEAFMVIVEEPFRNLGSKDYQSRMNRNAAIQTVISWFSKYKCPWHFAESREGAEFVSFHFLRHFYERVNK